LINYCRKFQVSEGFAMHFNNPEFVPTGTAKTLAVMLHRYRPTPDEMADAIEAVSKTYGRLRRVDKICPHAVLAAAARASRNLDSVSEPYIGDDFRQPG
jgi:hypothetical protein